MNSLPNHSAYEDHSDRIRISTAQGSLDCRGDVFLIALACPITGTVIIASDLPKEWKIAAGFLYFPIPEIFDIAAIAILGKPGFAWLKWKVLGFLRKHGPPAEVSRARYRLGLVLFVLPLVLAWILT